MQFKYIVPAVALVCAVAAPAQAEEKTLEQSVALANQMFDLMAKVNEKLATVKDTASADAAAPELDKLMGQIMEIQAKAVDYPQPSPEDMKSDAMVELQTKAGKVITELMGHQQRIMEAGVKSEAFEKAMNQTPAEEEKANDKKDDDKKADDTKADDKEVEVIVKEEEVEEDA